MKKGKGTKISSFVTFLVTSVHTCGFFSSLGEEDAPVSGGNLSADFSCALRAQSLKKKEDDSRLKKG